MLNLAVEFIMCDQICHCTVVKPILVDQAVLYLYLALVKNISVFDTFGHVMYF